MIIVDRALETRAAEHRPLRVAVVGAGFMAQGLFNQIHHSVPGMVVAAVVARRPDQAEAALRYAGYEMFKRATTADDLDAALAAGVPAVTDDIDLVVANGAIDAVVEATGAVDYGVRVTLAAIAAGKHVILLNAEVDGTVGPVLQVKARQAGVVVTGCDGDQPGVQGNLLRFVKSIGLTPMVAGNIKGLQDRFRTPTTQEGFARQWGQNVNMVTSFADGTKISFEQALVANAFDMTVSKRGMNGNDWTSHIDGATSLYDLDALLESGPIVDYVVGAQPGPGVYVFATHDDPKQQHYLKLYKLGDGPLYSFYTPYHLCHFEVPLSVVRAVDFADAALAPIGAPRVGVVAMAKHDLTTGHELDGLGGYDTYGEAETYRRMVADRLLPMGLAEGCRLRRPIETDRVLTFDDVDLPPGRMIDQIWNEQLEEFPGT